MKNPYKKKIKKSHTLVETFNPGDLIRFAIEALPRARAPYSGFFVAAALLSTNGKIFTGVNIESSSYSLTICAERLAIFKAISEGETSFSDIAIVTGSGKICPPCGACRQVLWDLSNDIRVILAETENSYQIMQLSELLPQAFNNRFLTS